MTIKSEVAMFIGMSIMLATLGETIDDNWQLMPPAVAASQRVSNGQIIQVRGTVQLKRSPNRVVNPTTGTLIYPGDELLTADGAQVVVQCSDLSLWSVQSGEKVFNSCATQGDCTSDLVECPHRGEVVWNDDIPYIISPRRTALLTPRPMLRWNPVTGATSYTVSVEGEGMQWTTQVSDTPVLYAGEQPLQPGGHYIVIVEADTGASSLDEPVKPGGLGFSVLDRDRAQNLSAEVQTITQHQLTEPAQALAIANLYINLYPENRLIVGAIEILEDLVKSGVRTAPLYRRIGDLYLNGLGLVPQAKEYYLKAVALTDSNNLEELTALQDGLGQVQAALGNQEEAIDWLVQALAGYQALGDLERAKELEHQLREFIQ